MKPLDRRVSLVYKVSTGVLVREDDVVPPDGLNWGLIPSDRSGTSKVRVWSIRETEFEISIISIIKLEGGQ